MALCTMTATIKMADTGEAIPAGNATLRIVKVLEFTGVLHAVQFVPVQSDEDGLLSLDAPRLAKLVLEATWPGRDGIDGNAPPFRVEVETPNEATLDLNPILQPPRP